MNVLARGRGIPNIYLKDAEKILAPYIGRRIEFEATAKQYRIVQTNRNTTSKSFSDGLTLPQPDVSDYSLRALANLRRDDSHYCGSKAANLRPYCKQQRSRWTLHFVCLLSSHDG